jgi:separase
LRGETQLCVELSDLCVMLSKLCWGPESDRLIAHQSKLAVHYVEIGLYAQAVATLKETEALMSKSNNLSPKVLAEFHLAQAEYLAGVGRGDEA